MEANDDSATFKVTCEHPKDGITSVNLRTQAACDDVSFTDRRTLIELAADAAYKAADHFRCTPEHRYPSSFHSLWIPDAELKKVASADGSCGWYAEFAADQPDETGLFGDEAREVTAQAFGGDRTPLPPGTSGRAELASVWWASSTCAGEPAVHTVSVSASYAEAVAPRLRALFKSHADEITARRDCTKIKLPAPSALPSA